MATRIVPPGTNIDLGLSDPFEKMLKYMEAFSNMSRGIAEVGTRRKANIMSTLGTVGQIHSQANDPGDLTAAYNIFNAIPHTYDPQLNAAMDVVEGQLNERSAQFYDVEAMGNELLGDWTSDWDPVLSMDVGAIKASDIQAWMTNKLADGKTGDVYAELIGKLEQIQKFKRMKDSVLGNKKHNFKFKDRDGNEIKAFDLTKK